MHDFAHSGVLVAAFSKNLLGGMQNTLLRIFVEVTDIALPIF